MGRESEQHRRITEPAEQTPAPRRPRRRARRRRESGSGHATRFNILLGTLATVVSIATGMFALRDNIWPQESGHVEASPAEYRAEIGRICDGIDEETAKRPARDRLLRRRLVRAKTTGAQRDLILGDVRAARSRSSQRLAQLAGLDAPRTVARHHERAVAAWRRNLSRSLDAEQRLLRVTSRGQLVAALRANVTTAKPIALDSEVQLSELIYLGNGSCRLGDHPSPSPFRLPPLAGTMEAGVTPDVTGGGPPSEPPPSGGTSTNDSGSSTDASGSDTGEPDVPPVVNSAPAQTQPEHPPEPGKGEPQVAPSPPTTNGG